MVTPLYEWKILEWDKKINNQTNNQISTSEKFEFRVPHMEWMKTRSEQTIEQVQGVLANNRISTRGVSRED